MHPEKMCQAGDKLTSSSSQHYARSFVVAVDVVHKILAGQNPESKETLDFQLNCNNIQDFSGI